MTEPRTITTKDQAEASDRIREIDAQIKLILEEGTNTPSEAIAWKSLQEERSMLKSKYQLN